MGWYYLSIPKLQRLWERISNFILDFIMDLIINPCWDLLIHVSKRSPSLTAVVACHHGHELPTWLSANIPCEVFLSFRSKSNYFLWEKAHDAAIISLETPYCFGHSVETSAEPSAAAMLFKKLNFFASKCFWLLKIFNSFSLTRYCWKWVERSCEI